MTVIKITKFHFLCLFCYLIESYIIQKLTCDPFIMCFYKTKTFHGTGFLSKLELIDNPFSYFLSLTQLVFYISELLTRHRFIRPFRSSNTSSGKSSAQSGDCVFVSWLPRYASLPLMVDSLHAFPLRPI